MWGRHGRRRSVHDPALLAFRLPKDRMARFLGLFLMAFGVAGPVTLAPEFIGFWETAAARFVVPFTLFTYLSWPLMPVFFVVYPDGKFVPEWIRWATVYGLFFTVSWATFPEVFGRPSVALSAWIFLSVIAIFSWSLYSQIYRSRRDSTVRYNLGRISPSP
jgi:hypothetical protein